MTYDQSDSMVVLGPLAARPTAYAYDLCATHTERFTAPLGWQLVRLQTHFDAAPPSVSDIEALVDTIQKVAAASETTSNSEQTPQTTNEHTPDEHEATVTELPLARLRARETSLKNTQPGNEPELGPFRQ